MSDTKISGVKMKRNRKLAEQLEEAIATLQSGLGLANTSNSQTGVAQNINQGKDVTNVTEIVEQKQFFASMVIGSTQHTEKNEENLTTSNTLSNTNNSTAQDQNETKHWLFHCQLKMLNDILLDYKGVGKVVDSSDPITPWKMPRGYETFKESIINIRKCEFTGNVSDHYPLLLSLDFKTTKSSNTKPEFKTKMKVKWDKADLLKYTEIINEGLITSLKVINTKDDIETGFHDITAVITKATNEIAQKPKIRKNKPKLKVMSDEILKAIKNKKSAFYYWKANGRPTDCLDPFLLEKKITTQELRKTCRLEIAQKRMQERNEIIEASSSNKTLFYKLINKQRGKLSRRIDELNVDNLYQNAVSYVKWDNSFSEDFFKIEQGVRQGGTLSADLYKLYINPLLNFLCDSGLGGKIGNINCCAPTCADDVALLSCNPLIYKQWILEIERYCSASSRQSFTYWNNEISKLFCTNNCWRKFEKNRRAIYSLMGTGLHGENGLDPETSIAMLRTYILSILTYWLEIVLPKGKILTIYRSNTKKLIKQILYLICIKYNLENPLSLLYNEMSKGKWKKITTTAVHKYWTTRINEEIMYYSSLKYIPTSSFKVGKIHPLALANSANQRDIKFVHQY
ncbi:unnamed protein product [Mytilus edulis]|uniref:Reverse transcriptase domain-containing protein n=1 Tax=Mytilus edulis TaxID=6550 RepID=A0A8S3T4J5_MYTED|nr:unnamed protein product [Mytilus edulis]